MSEQKPKKKMGRPRLGAAVGVKLHVSLEPEFVDAFKAEAERNGQKPTQLMREVLMDWIRERRTFQERSARFEKMKAHVGSPKGGRGWLHGGDEV